MIYIQTCLCPKGIKISNESEAYNSSFPNRMNITVIIWIRRYLFSLFHNKTEEQDVVIHISLILYKTKRRWAQYKQPEPVHTGPSSDAIPLIIILAI